MKLKHVIVKIENGKRQWWFADNTRPEPEFCLFSKAAADALVLELNAHYPFDAKFEVQELDDETAEEYFPFCIG